MMNSMQWVRTGSNKGLELPKKTKLWKKHKQGMHNLLKHCNFANSSLILLNFQHYK